jgi:hypothetical protein
MGFNLMHVVVDPEGLDLRGAVLLDHKHELVTGVVLEQGPLGVSLYHPLEGLLVGEESLPTLDDQCGRVGDEVVEGIAILDRLICGSGLGVA